MTVTPVAELDADLVDQVPVENYPEVDLEDDDQGSLLKTSDIGWLDEALDALSNGPESTNIRVGNIIYL